MGKERVDDILNTRALGLIDRADQAQAEGQKGAYDIEAALFADLLLQTLQRRAGMIPDVLARVQIRIIPLANPEPGAPNV